MPVAAPISCAFRLFIFVRKSRFFVSYFLDVTMPQRENGSFCGPVALLASFVHLLVLLSVYRYFFSVSCLRALTSPSTIELRMLVKGFSKSGNHLTGNGRS